MKLYCVRHGEACGPEMAGRPLTEQGLAEIEREARHMAKAGVRIAHILHSPKLRTTQTAQVFAKALDMSDLAECDALINPANSPQPVIELLQSFHEDTMLVGHMPLISELISALVVGKGHFSPIVNYPPGAVVCLEQFDAGRWVINWVLQPQIVPNLS